MHYTCDHWSNVRARSGGTVSTEGTTSIGGPQSGGPTPHASGGTTPYASTPYPSGGTTSHANFGSSATLPGPYQPPIGTAPVSGTPLVCVPPSATGTFVPGPQPGTYYQGSANPQAGMAQQRAQFFDSAPGTSGGGHGSVTFSPAPPTYHAYFGAPGIQVHGPSAAESEASDAEYFFDAIESTGHLVQAPILDSGCSPTVTPALQDFADSAPDDAVPDDGWDFADPWLDDDDVAMSYFGSASKGFGG